MKKITQNILLVALLSSGIGLVSSASAESKEPGTGPNPFSDCGIGAALFPTTGWAAVTSNVIWDLGTTAVTSATKSPNTCNGKNVKTALFIRDSYMQLVEEAAIGQGTHLTAALNLMQCGGAHDNAIQAVRSSMGQVISQSGYQAKSHMEKSADFYSVINTAVASNCSI